MKVTKLLKGAMLGAAALLLSACGGGGGSGNDSGFNPPGITVSASAAGSTVQSGRTVNITVNVRQANGAAITDGTAVNAVVAPANIGSVVAIGPNGPTGGATANTVGGVANFRFTGVSVGTATVTFSVTDPAAPGRSITTSIQIAVTQGVDRLNIAATTTTLPLNAFNVLPFVGSPYMAEVTVTLRTASGELVNAQNGIQVSVNPVGNTGGFSTLDDPSTPDVNEFQVRLGQGSVNVVAGKATLFMHSLNFTGQTTMTITGRDPETNETVTASQVFTIVSTTPPLPSEVLVSPTTAPQYVVGSGGDTSGQFEVRVNDGVGQPVPNPVAGNNAFNNVLLEIIGEAHGARLQGISASGQTVSGSSISVRTTNGITGANLISGTVPGNVLIRATSDRADNNVDNGISDAVFGQRTVAVSDGVLFDVDITEPVTNALEINPVATGVVTAPGAVPPSPDGTYSATVAAIATDRLGNPVLPGTTLTFGLIDEPQVTGFGDFFLSGGDGDPQEGGTTFTALSGAFTTAGGGAGPGDALVVFGENVIGNRDHESVRRIERINSPTNLTVNRRFNFNDLTGTSVNSGGILPYVIGRAADGNITASATTNELGVARVQMNYPVSKLGKRVVIWAQGDGAIVAGAPKTVTDAEFTVFAGVAPATLVVSPATIAGNTTATVTACVFDRLGSPIGGVPVGFAFASLGGGQGSIDGISASGSFANPTGFGGCTTGTVVTTGITASTGTIQISAAGQSATVAIQIGQLILTAQPSAFFGSGGTTTLRLVDASGQPVPNVQLTGTCVGAAGALVSTTPVSGTTGITNANGEARFDITTQNLNQVGSAGSGTCTYTTASGAPSAIVRIQGIDICVGNFSPPAPGCPTPVVPQVALTLNLNGGAGTPGAVASSQPAGIACTKPVGAAQVCNASFDSGANVSVTVQAQDAMGAPTNANFSVSGNCAVTAVAAQVVTVSVTMSAARTCTIDISP